MSLILVIVLIMLLLGALPMWGYSSGWGWGPPGIVGLLLIVLVIAMLTGRF